MIMAKRRVSFDITSSLHHIDIILYYIILSVCPAHYSKYDVEIETHDLKGSGDDPSNYYALLQVRLLRIERMKKEEAERIRQEEEERLRQKMREAEARKEAERLHQERLKQIEEEKKREEGRREEERRERAQEVRRMEEEAKQRRDMPVEDSKVVEEMFGFLGDQQHGGDIDPCEPACDYHVIVSYLWSYALFHSSIPVALSPIPVPEAEEDLTEYRFPKFAATYFQGAATHSYIRRALKQPLLALKNEQDRQVWT